MKITRTEQFQIQKIDNIQTNINIQKLNTGIYYCKLKQNGTVFKFEVVK